MTQLANKSFYNLPSLIRGMGSADEAVAVAALKELETHEDAKFLLKDLEQLVKRTPSRRVYRAALDVIHAVNVEEWVRVQRENPRSFRYSVTPDGCVAAA